ncbi:ORF131 [Ranid herpesvirus 1]|uniref:ORF131 n=1 Tax=Ranid herpesvirus 1 TaxID=85655 RepID=Q14VJ9_9VIRU|nr:ORF131 [Ranid herpesvirus 1]ABG25761.1 ORF131 [Ranid herpesvirus 1]
MLSRTWNGLRFILGPNYSYDGGFTDAVFEHVYANIGLALRIFREHVAAQAQQDAEGVEMIPSDFLQTVARPAVLQAVESAYRGEEPHGPIPLPWLSLPLRDVHTIKDNTTEESLDELGRCCAVVCFARYLTNMGVADCNLPGHKVKIYCLHAALSGAPAVGARRPLVFPPFTPVLEPAPDPWDCNVEVYRFTPRADDPIVTAACSQTGWARELRLRGWVRHALLSYLPEVRATAAGVITRQMDRRYVEARALITPAERARAQWAYMQHYEVEQQHQGHLNFQLPRAVHNRRVVPVRPRRGLDRSKARRA